MWTDSLWDPSSNGFNSQWAFAQWANDKGVQSRDLSYVTLAEYLVNLFTQYKQVNTIKVHRASIASVLKLLNPPTALQEDTIHNAIHGRSILRSRTQEVLPRWHLSIVLKGPMKPPFAINGLDRNISFELLSYKTALLIALTTCAHGYVLVALSLSPHNIEFKTLASGLKHLSIRMVPKIMPKNQIHELIPKPLEFPGKAPLFPKDLEQSLCAVWVLGLYMLQSAERGKEDPQQKLFVHSPRTPSSSLRTSDTR